MKIKIFLFIVAVFATGFMLKSDEENYFYIPKNFPKPV
jgi:hypothetical protein